MNDYKNQIDDLRIADLVEMIEKRYRDAVALASAERDADMEFVNRLRSRFQKAGSLAQPTAGPSQQLSVADASSANDALFTYGGMARLIRDVAKQQTGPFTVGDVVDAIRKQTNVVPNRTTVSGILQKMTKARQLQCLVAGTGKRPSKYAPLSYFRANEGDESTERQVDESDF